MHFRSPLGPIAADWYFEQRRMPPDPKGGKDYEHPAGVNSELLASEITRIADLLATSKRMPSKIRLKMSEGKSRDLTVEDLADPVMIIVEGFLLFHDWALASLFDCCLWLDVEMETLVQRRFKRNGGGKSIDQFRRWYKARVWTAYELYKPTQLANAGERALVRLDGSLPPQDIAVEAARHVQRCCDGSGGTVGPAAPAPELAAEVSKLPAKVPVEVEEVEKAAAPEAAEEQAEKRAEKAAEAQQAEKKAEKAAEVEEAEEAERVEAAEEAAEAQ